MDNFKDTFLIAMPHLSETFFEKTVIYICDHGVQGAMGMVINRPLASGKVAVVLESLGLTPTGGLKVMDVYYGGPVQPALGFVLHSSEYAIDNTEQISSRISLSTNVGIFKDIQKGRGPDQFRFTLGYAGWGASQLDQEIANGDWLVVPAEPTFIFDIPDHSKWREAASRFGIEIAQFSGSGGVA